MNKKLTFIIILISATLLMMSAVSAEGWFDFLSGDESNANDDQTFIVGLGDDFPPFLYKDDAGEYTGLDIELAKEVAKRNNWSIKFQPTIDWDTKEFELNSDEIDCIWSELTIDGRENDFTWSDPYFNNAQVFIVKNNSINSIDDLDGKVVEVVVSSSASDALDGNNKSIKDTFAKVNEVHDFDSAFLDLDAGVCDAIICDDGYADYIIKEKFSDKSFKILDDPLTFEKYGVGFKKGNDALRNQVQKTLDEMFKDGTVDKIAQNYSDYQIPERIIYP